VAFAESEHGFGRASGLAAIPTRWRVMLGGLVLAVVVLALARLRRLGPPERTAEDLPPPRRAYVESMAVVLARTRSPESAAAALREDARRHAVPGRLSPDDAAALDAPVRSDEELVALGRVRARLLSGSGE
jgi:hypothetical protein